MLTLEQKIKKPSDRLQLSFTLNSKIDDVNDFEFALVPEESVQQGKL